MSESAYWRRCHSFPVAHWRAAPQSVSPSESLYRISRKRHLDSDAIAAEYPNFCTAFGSLNLIELCKSYHVEIINDQPVDTAVIVVDEETVEAQQPTADVDHGGSRVEETCRDQRWRRRRLSWWSHRCWQEEEMQNFIIPLKACYQLSGYPYLLRLFWILCTPPSQQLFSRARSRLGIIKNRLRSTMCDEWTEALMVHTMYIDKRRNNRQLRCVERSPTKTIAVSLN